MITPFFLIFVLLHHKIFSHLHFMCLLNHQKNHYLNILLLQPFPAPLIYNHFLNLLLLHCFLILPQITNQRMFIQLSLNPNHFLNLLHNQDDFFFPHQEVFCFLIHQANQYKYTTNSQVVFRRSLFLKNLSEKTKANQKKKAPVLFTKSISTSSSN